MYRQLTVLLSILLLGVMGTAQQKTAVQQKTTQQKAAPPTHPAPNPAPTTTTNLPSEDTVNAFLQNMFGYDQSLTWKILEIKPSAVEGLAEVDVVITGAQGQQGNKFYVTADGQHAITGDIIPFGEHPFASAKQKLDKGLTGPSRGPADAPVTLVEFSDLQCPHCKEAQPTIDKLISEEKNVRLVFQNFPLPSHDWAAKAADYADCIAQTNNDAFWKFMQSVYDNQTSITAANADEKLNGLADAAGMKSADVAACAAKPETASRVEHSVELGKSLEVTGTPTLFINGRKVGNVGGVPYEVIKNLVEYGTKQGK